MNEPDMDERDSRRSRRWSDGLALCLLACLGLQGCATTSQAPGVESSPEALVEARARARWDALLAQEYQQAYQFLTPGDRSALEPWDYELRLRANRARVQWIGAEIKDVGCAELRCEVSISLTSRFMAPVPGVKEMKVTTQQEEQWILIDDAWWHVRAK